MKDLEEPRDPVSPRATLKLKSPGKARAPVLPPSPAPQAPPKARSAVKTVDWADEHKQRMQADMDALGGGSAPSQQPGIKRR